MNSSLIIECSHQLRKVHLTEIYHLFYIDGVITIELNNGEKLMCCIALKELEDKLSASFVRINRNTIINILFLVAYFKNTQKVTMENGRSFTVSRRNVPLLINRMREHYPMVK